MKNSYVPYIVPFIVFLVLTYAGSWFLVSYKLTEQSLKNLKNKGIPDEILEDLKLLEDQQFTKESEFLVAVEQQIGTEQLAEHKDPILEQARIPYGTYLFYPLKTLLVAAILFYYRKSYTEVTFKVSWIALLVGIFVFILWVVPEGWYPQIGSSEFNPYILGKGWFAYIQITFRLIGAVVVVPIFEELFWRSFAIRWLIDEKFTNVPIGTFTWFSCIVIVLGFGFEHHRWLVGLLAGILYNALLYYKKNLSDCILAHAVTNLLLGIYVLLTQQWTFW